MALTEIPPKKTLEEAGFSTDGQSALKFSGSEVNQKALSLSDSGVPSNFIQDGDTIVRLNVVDGFLQSGNFVTGVSGWQIESDGDVEFNNGVFRGSLSAASGSLGAITIGTNAYHVDSSGNIWWGESATFAGATYKISNAGVANLSGIDVSVSFDEIEAGTNVNALNVGDAKISLDGANKRIVINDGTNDRILMGYLAGKF